MDFGGARIECPAKPITHAFIHFANDGERNKFIRSTTTGMKTLSKKCNCGYSTVLCTVWLSAPDTTTATGMYNLSKNCNCGISTAFCNVWPKFRHNDGHVDLVQELRLWNLHWRRHLDGHEELVQNCACGISTGNATTTVRNCNCGKLTVFCTSRPGNLSCITTGKTTLRKNRRGARWHAANAPSGSRTPVTSMGGLYDAVTDANNLRILKRIGCHSQGFPERELPRFRKEASILRTETFGSHSLKARSTLMPKKLPHPSPKGALTTTRPLLVNARPTEETCAKNFADTCYTASGPRAGNKRSGTPGETTLHNQGPETVLRDRTCNTTKRSCGTGLAS